MRLSLDKKFDRDDPNNQIADTIIFCRIFKVKNFLMRIEVDRSGMSFKLRSFWPRNKNKGRIPCFFGVVGGCCDAGMAVLMVIWLGNSNVAYYLDTGTKVRYPGKHFNSNGLFEHYSLFFSVHGIEG
jgi:hypothetical protein